jgi:FMN phosphatase YigB (HAD superfamily)/DNA-binding XRE family transcriptional regulator
MDEQGLAKRLQEVRKQAGLTQQELCQKANLSYSTLAKIERGAIKSPSIFTIQSIAAALDISLDELLGAPAVKDSAKSVSKNGVRFVYFDVNGCLVRFYQGAFVRLAADTGASADAIEMAYWHLNEQACLGKISVDDVNRGLAERLGVPLIDWQSAYFEAIKPVEGMKELLTWVADNYKIGLLTNIMPGFLPKMLLDGLVPNLKYDAVVDSSEVGLIKPDPAIYQLAAERAGVAPSEILFVDDERANIVEADQAGWHVLRFDGYEPEQSIARIHSALEIAILGAEPTLSPEIAWTQSQ